MENRGRKMPKKSRHKRIDFTARDVRVQRRRAPSDVCRSEAEGFGDGGGHRKKRGDGNE